MALNLSPYPEYKNTFLPWFERIPVHWDLIRQRNAVDMLVSNVDKHSLEGEIPVRLCNYVDVYKNRHITNSLRFMDATATAEELKQFQLKLGDVLITKDSESWTDIGVPSHVEYTSPDLVCGYHLAILRPKDTILSGEYLMYLHQCQGVSVQYQILANGVTRYGLSHDAIKSVFLPIPPLTEQTSIVHYLNHIDKRITRYIRAKRRQIELLNEQKQAIIQQAVTCGMDPQLRLKPSGVEWLGDVPEEWEVLRSKYIFQEKDHRSITGQETHLSMSQKFGLVPSSEIEERRLMSESYLGAKICEENDLVLNRLKAHLGVFALAPQQGLVSPDYTIFRAIKPIYPKYFELVLKTPACRVELRKRAKGIVQGFWRLYTDDFYDIRLPFPPFEEQERIIGYLENQLVAITTSISQLNNEIELILEYRTRLISDVVTGKLDVRAAAQNLPNTLTEDNLLELDSQADLDENEGDVVDQALEGDDGE